MLLVVLVFPGLGSLVGGIAISLSARRETRRRGRLFAAKLVPIADARADAIVGIAGTIVMSDEGTVATPFTGRNVVWFTTTVRTNNENSVEVLRVVDSREFFVEDGSGVRARIRPAEAIVLVAGRTTDLDEDFHERLAARGVEVQRFLGFGSSYEMSESVLALGMKVFVVGPSRRVVGPVTVDGYRDRASTELVLHRRPGPAGELTITDESPTSLAEHGRKKAILGLVVAGLGLGMIAIAFASLLQYRP